MEKKNEALDNSAEEVVEETEEVEETDDVEEEEQDDSEEQSDDDSDNLQAQLDKLKRDNGILRRKLTKVEKKDEPKSENKANLQDSLTVEKVQEIARLSAKYSPEEIEELDYIAAREGISSSEAEKSIRFKTFREALEKENKAKEASLGASNSSGSRKKAKDFSTPGLSPEEHKKLWEKQRKA